MPFTADEVSAIVRQMMTNESAHKARLRVRRLLLEMSADAKQDNTGTGTNVPAPFDQSKLILRTLIGEPVQEARRYAARIAANPPQPRVTPPASGNELTQRVERHAADQERLMVAMWQDAHGRREQRRMAWSVTWGRVGWYLTLPTEAAWGMPEREYYDHVPAEQLETLRKNGTAVPASGGRYAESGGSYLERRRAKAKTHAVDGLSLNTLESYPPDMVWHENDRAGIKWAAIVEEVPASNFRAGSDEAIRLAKRLKVATQDIERFGLRMENGKITAGLTQGAEPGGMSTWSFVTFLTRDHIYYLVAPSGVGAGGQFIYDEAHDDGCVPLVPAYFAETDSRRPGQEATSPLEALFAVAPLVNQLETQLSNVAAWNSFPRWVIELPDGTLAADPETGEPMVMTEEPTVGTDPQFATPVRGKVVQLVINADMLQKLLAFYVERMDHYTIPDIAVGAAGTTGPAWTARQQIAQTQIDLQPAVQNHADAIKEVWRIWIRRAKALNCPLYAFAAPGTSKDAQRIRGLLEFDPANLVEAFGVDQDSNNASDRVVLQQAGIELHQAGYIDLHTLYEDYFLEADSRDAEVRAYTEKIVQAVAYGNVNPATQDPILGTGGVLYRVAAAVQGKIALMIMERSPQAAMAQAESMAAQAQLPPPGMNPAGGNPAEAMGVRQPGMGASLTQPGTAGGGAPEMAPQPVQVA